MELSRKSRMKIFRTGSFQLKGECRLLHELDHCTKMVSRLVERPITIKLKELIADYHQITCPITLVCAGNRRKEQNVVRKTKGFSWGAAGVSNALWTGVALGEVLKRAGLKRGARHVCMEGADKLVRIRLLVYKID